MYFMGVFGGKTQCEHVNETKQKIVFVSLVVNCSKSSNIIKNFNLFLLKLTVMMS